MPRYHFVIREDGIVYPDDEGVECFNLNDAEHEAVVAATSIGRELSYKGPPTLRIDIFDDKRRKVSEVLATVRVTRMTDDAEGRAPFPVLHLGSS